MDIRVETRPGQSAYPVIYFKMVSAYTEECSRNGSFLCKVRNVSECSIVGDFVLKRKRIVLNQQDSWDLSFPVYMILMIVKISMILIFVKCCGQ